MNPPPLIEFLFWKECPSHPKAWERLQNVLRDMEMTADIWRIEVKTEQEARKLFFPGSPTIRVNGEDIDAGGAAQQAHRLTCRIYYDREGKVTPVPPPDLFTAALKKYC